MAEGLVTFPNFDPATDSVKQIGLDDLASSSYDQLRIAFAPGAQDVPLRELIRYVAPHADLTRNVNHATAVLSDPNTLEELGFRMPVSPDQAAHDIVLRSGLYEGVDRPLIRPVLPDERSSKRYDYAVLLEGREKRMRTGAQALAGLLLGGVEIGEMIGVSSGRKVAAGESELFPAGTPSHEMMEGVLEHELAIKPGVGVVKMLHTDETSGKQVAAEAAKYITEKNSADPKSLLVVVPSAPGAWIEKGFVTRRALRSAIGKSTDGRVAFDGDRAHPQLTAVSYAATLINDSEESAGRMQRPLTALGDVVRSLMYLEELQASLHG